MNDFSNFISQYYDGRVDDEWERMDRHRTEYALTSLALAESLPPPPAQSWTAAAARAATLSIWPARVTG